MGIDLYGVRAGGGGRKLLFVLWIIIAQRAAECKVRGSFGGDGDVAADGLEFVAVSAAAADAAFAV